MVAVGFGTNGQGPLGSVDTVRAWGGLDPVAEDVPSASTPVTAPGTTVATSTTSTTITLSVADESPGVCLVWDQTPGIPSPRRTDAVACEAEHLFEVTSAFEIDGSPYAATGPTDAEWDVVFDTECQARADAFLGYPLDPVGRFAPTAIAPTAEGWVAGDRHVLCGMSVVPTTAETAGLDQLTPFVGMVGGADQARYIGVGTCLDVEPPVGTGAPVDCLGPHGAEIVGTADVSWLGPAYPGSAVIADAANASCLAAAQLVYGGVLPADVAFGSFEVAESSWNVGRRVVECMLGRRDATGWIMSPGPVRLGSP